MASNFKNNRKAQSFGYFEIVLVVAVLFIVAAAWLATNYIGGEINQYLLDDPDFLTHNESQAVLQDLDTRSTSFFDYAFVLMFLGLFFLGGVSAWYSGSSPVFFVVTFLFVLMVLVVPFLLGDVWSELADEFDENLELRYMGWFMGNHLLFSLVFVFFVLGVMYFRSRLDA